MKRFLVIVDYQHAGFGFLVDAPSKESLEQAVGARDDPGTEVIEDGIAEHPLVRYEGERMDVYDLQSPAGTLLSLMRERGTHPP